MIAVVVSFLSLIIFFALALQLLLAFMQCIAQNELKQALIILLHCQRCFSLDVFFFWNSALFTYVPNFKAYYLLHYIHCTCVMFYHRKAKAAAAANSYIPMAYFVL